MKREEEIFQNRVVIDWSNLQPIRNEVIQWLVDFAQADFETMEHEQKEQWRIQAGMRFSLFGVNTPVRFPDFILPQKDSKESWERMKGFQNTIRRVIEEVLPKEDAGIFLHHIEASFHLNRSGRLLRMDINPTIKTFEEGFRFSFYRLVEGLPPKVIQRCLACKKIFINLTRREKHFCSNKCLWRFNAEKQRKADPEGYRKRQREVMKKRYEKKMKAKGYKKISHHKKGGK